MPNPTANVARPTGRRTAQQERNEKGFLIDNDRDFRDDLERNQGQEE
jgi:hypothetical protein